MKLSRSQCEAPWPREQDWEGADGGVMKDHTRLLPPRRAQALWLVAEMLSLPGWRESLAPPQINILRLNISLETGGCH